jgi:hypothetical protein
MVGAKILPGFFPSSQCGEKNAKHASPIFDIMDEDDDKEERTNHPKVNFFSLNPNNTLFIMNFLTQIL